MSPHLSSQNLFYKVSIIQPWCSRDELSGLQQSSLYIATVWHFVSMQSLFQTGWLYNLQMLRTQWETSRKQPSYHGHHRQGICLQLALHPLGNGPDEWECELCKLLWPQVSCMWLKKLERLSKERSKESALLFLGSFSSLLYNRTEQAKQI